MSAPTPGYQPQAQSITLHEQSRQLEVAFSDGAAYRIPLELLRVYSPSAEVQGHGPGQERLQTGKRDVMLLEIEPVGHYAIQPTFSDGHDSGIYTWAYLYELGRDQELLWQQYLERLAAAGASRDAPMNAGKAPQSGCGGGGGCGG